MKYFVKLNQTYSTKNKARREIQNFAIKVDCTLLLTDKAKKEFKSEFEKFVDDVNARYPSCHNIKLGYSRYKYDSIYCESNFSMSIFEVKQEKV